MRIPRLYVSQDLSNCEQVTLGETESHYLSKVLRMDSGRELIAFNGDGAEYSAVISLVEKKAVHIKIVQQQKINRESPLRTHLAIGVSRGERMDWVLQKATELGVTEITPIFSERTEVKLKGDRLGKKMDHWRHITISACEQCQRNVLPQLHEAQDLTEFLPNLQSELKLVLHHRSAQNLQQFAKPTSAAMLIGPEGGLSDDEIDLAIQFGFHSLTLGPRVLRTETAPITALTGVQLLWGDLA